jgi:flagellar protein FliL
VSATTATASTAPAKPKGKAKATPARRRLVLVAVLLAVGAASGGGWWWWQGRQAAEAESAPAARAPAQYHPLDPAFVVNLADTDAVRYLQADVQLVSRDADTLAAFDAHAPAIRNRLLLLFGQQSALQLGQRSGKERLQQAAREEVRALLKAEGAPAEVEAVIFTSLVTQ